jgi:hypothetical protein
MGQYFVIANLEKREYLDPWKMYSGAKAWEQAMNMPSKALLVLLGTGMGRGGGDFREGEMPDGSTVNGRWAGDSIVMVGDYAEDGDLPDILAYGSLYSQIFAEEGNWVDLSVGFPKNVLEDFGELT